MDKLAEVAGEDGHGVALVGELACDGVAELRADADDGSNAFGVEARHGAHGSIGVTTFRESAFIEGAFALEKEGILTLRRCKNLMVCFSLKSRICNCIW